MPKHMTIQTPQGNLPCTVRGKFVFFRDVMLDVHRTISAIRCVLNSGAGMRIYARSGSVGFIAHKRFRKGWLYEIRIHGTEHEVNRADLEELLNMLEAHHANADDT